MSNLIPRNNNRGMESGDLFRDFFGPRFMEGFFDGTGLQGIRADILDQKDAYEVLWKKAGCLYPCDGLFHHDGGGADFSSWLEAGQRRLAVRKSGGGLFSGWICEDQWGMVFF